MARLQMRYGYPNATDKDINVETRGDGTKLVVTSRSLGRIHAIVAYQIERPNAMESLHHVDIKHIVAFLNATEYLARKHCLPEAMRELCWKVLLLDGVNFARHNDHITRTHQLDVVLGRAKLSTDFRVDLFDLQE